MTANVRREVYFRGEVWLYSEMASARRVAALAVLVGAVVPLSAVALDWSPVDKAIEAAMAAKVFPGCVAGVAGSSGQLYLKAFGSFTYGEPAPVSGGNPAVQESTRYDMARWAAAACLVLRANCALHDDACNVACGCVSGVLTRVRESGRAV